MTVCKGEFWGITKTSLWEMIDLMRRSGVLKAFYGIKINERAKRYYIHAPLRIYHTEGADRVMKAKYNFTKEVVLYENLIYEDNFLDRTRTYDPGQYFCSAGMG